MSKNFGSDHNPTGMFNLYGRRPGSLEADEDFQAFYKNYMNIITYTSTYEAIARVIPEPLEPNYDFPPIVSVVHLQQVEDGNMKAFCGRSKPYREIGTWVPVKYKDHVGVNIPFLYLDGSGVDIAVAGGREVFGYPKAQAHIHSYRQDDEFHSSVVRDGRTLFQMEMTIKEELPVEGSMFGDMGSAINVKEIPSADFHGYDVRKVIEHKLGQGSSVIKIWNAEGKLTLGGSHHDPVDILEIVEMGPCFQVWSDSLPGQVITSPDHAIVIEDLLAK